MTKKLKTDFLSLLKNEKFIRLAKQSDDSSKLSEHLRTRYPDDADEIQNAIQFVQVNMQEQKRLAPDDFNEILSSVLFHSKSTKREKRRKLIVSYSWKAAVVFFVMAFGTLFILKEADDPIKKFAQSTSERTDRSMIVLSDGTKHLLEHDDSSIEYDSVQAEVIVRKDEKEEERIENKEVSDNRKLNQIIVPYGQKQTITLCDGSVVQLNAGSSLTFPAKFSGKNREVYLKGEGYFDVQKNEKLPFVVKTDQMDVKVLGTSFNVAAYDDENTVSTVLVEGKVEVSRKGSVFFKDKQVIAPGQGYFYNADADNAVIRSVEVENYTSWVNGVFIFREKPLSEIVKRLTKYYNCSIHIEGEKLASTQVTGKLDISGNIDDAMQYLSKTIEGRYDKSPEDIYVLRTDL
ncbi:FecR family protein [Mariniphaga anaerophila]|uniref:FecR family protein n=1 Tax=Mariniphaga anaerophila TaxID=1484053 RepID=A0A1M5F911_9BACT|nr:FecR domain-containing protein [Mariniphaga anaerophila]SHF87878.1 FecR family protein [Mariniphaga anaerophila]